MDSSIKLILASQSPRRKDLINQLGFPFKVVKFDFDENYAQDMNRYDVPVFLALNKSKQVPLLNNDEVLITADTVVILNNNIMEKPSSLEEAKQMLHQLSNNIHDVVTGVCLRSNKYTESFSVKSTIHFTELTTQEIDYYVNKYQPLDKAGAYGIQEWIGMIGVKKIIGSYYNVVGLPVHEIYQRLKEKFTNT
jgi:septum formation protein